MIDTPMPTVPNNETMTAKDTLPLQKQKDQFYRMRKHFSKTSGVLHSIQFLHVHDCDYKGDWDIEMVCCVGIDFPWNFCKSWIL